MDISIILPARARPIMLTNMIDSLVRTAEDASRVEVILCIDNDDTVLLRMLRTQSFGVKIKYLVSDQSDNFVKDYINPMAMIAQGRWIITLNDDAEFQSKGWDKILLDTMDSQSDNIYLGLPYDGINNLKNERESFSCFPIQSMQAVHGRGYFFYPKTRIWGSDQIIADVYRKIHRIVRVAIKIQHLNQNHKVRHGEFETNYNRFLDLDKKHPHGVTEEDIHKESVKLKMLVDYVWE